MFTRKYGSDKLKQTAFRVGEVVFFVDPRRPCGASITFEMPEEIRIEEVPRSRILGGDETPPARKPE